MITDDRGGTPNFVIVGDTMTHIPTGLFVKIEGSGDDDDLRRAHTELKRKIRG